MTATTTFDRIAIDELFQVSGGAIYRKTGQFSARLVDAGKDHRAAPYTGIDARHPVVVLQ